MTQENTNNGTSSDIDENSAHEEVVNQETVADEPASDESLDQGSDQNCDQDTDQDSGNESNIETADGEMAEGEMTDSETTEKLDNEPPKLDSELANIIEAALYAAKEPLGVRKLASLFPDDAQPTKVDIQNVILTLQEQCENRGIELRRIGTGWRYQTKEKYSPWLRKLSGQKTPRYSRALLETLSIIAYRQPVTRGDIEEIRGVGVSSETIRTLEERGWVAQIGHRDVPGRPALFGTSQGFLEYFDMTGLSELPELMEKRELRAIANEMNLTLPMDGVQNETNTPDAEAPDQQSSSEQKTGQQSISEQSSDEASSSSVEVAEVIELHPASANDEADVEDSDFSDASEIDDPLDASDSDSGSDSDPEHNPSAE